MLIYVKWVELLTSLLRPVRSNSTLTPRAGAIGPTSAVGFSDFSLSGLSLSGIGSCVGVGAANASVGRCR